MSIHFHVHVVSPPKLQKEDEMVTYSVVTEKMFSCLRICAGYKSRVLFGFFMPMNFYTHPPLPFMNDLVFMLLCYFVSLIMAYSTI